MLVLSRQRDETIMIGDHIEVTVVDIRGDKVRLGINAPTSIAVHRKEVYDAIKRENEQAARLDQRQLDGIRVPAGTRPAAAARGLAATGTDGPPGRALRPMRPSIVTPRPGPDGGPATNVRPASQPKPRTA